MSRIVNEVREQILAKITPVTKTKKTTKKVEKVIKKKSNKK